MDKSKIIEEGFLHIKKMSDGSIIVTPEITLENQEELSELIAAIHLMSGYLSANLNYLSVDSKEYIMNNNDCGFDGSHLKLVVDNDKKNPSK